MLPASVLYGGQEGLKPLSFKMCAFQGEKPLTNRLLVADAHTLIVAAVIQRDTAVESGDFLIDLFFPAHSVLLL